ncbi:MAG: efflux RND transporter periplasmic adaptor subunit [Candidatus Pacebacteria bacterium]|nr:efflux RND transporter periplasmic adaptor subunit [Candidatus Paceibacterota bacterium]
MKKKIIASAVGLILIFFLVYRFSKKAPTETQSQSRAPLDITFQTAANSHDFKETLTYPATVASDQEITVTAKAAGNASEVPFSLGDQVSAGSLLARIDDTGNTLGQGYEDFQSSQVQETQFSKEQAAEQLSLDKKNYKDLKKAYDQEQNNSTLAKTVSKAQVDAAQKQIDIDNLKLSGLRVSLKSTLDDHIITSPIAGFIIGKSVSVGDSVNVGQTLATISQTKNVKLQFFVDPDHLAEFPQGQIVSVVSDGGQNITASVKNISPVADPATKRFLLEAYPQSQIPVGPLLAPGTLATVTLETTRHPSVSGDFLLPLSAITVGQNNSYLFIDSDGKAKKIDAAIVSVEGEAAEIKADIPSNAKIILNGSRLVQDGDPVNIAQN